MIACPLGTDIFGFIGFLKKGDITGAWQAIIEENPFPALTGRFGAEPGLSVQVMNKAGEPVGYRMLERFIGDEADYSPWKEQPAATGQRVAVVGSGPAGLTAAYFLRKAGHEVTVFESRGKCGGVLRYGYPEFRLPQAIVDKTIAWLEECGVTFTCNVMIGQTRGFEQLRNDGFDALFLATGAGIAKRLKFHHQPIPGVVSGDEFLSLCRFATGDVNAVAGLGKRVVVIGDGNTALDCARTCIRFGADVVLVSQGTRDDFKVKNFIAEHAREEGVRIEALTRALDLGLDERGMIDHVKCRRFDFADENNSGVWKLIEVPDSDFTLSAETVIVAVGHEPNALFARNEGGIKLNSDGTIWTKNESHMTEIDGVFSGGNVVDGPGSLMAAMVSAKTAAGEINEYLGLKG